MVLICKMLKWFELTCSKNGDSFEECELRSVQLEAGESPHVLLRGGTELIVVEKDNDNLYFVIAKPRTKRV